MHLVVVIVPVTALAVFLAAAFPGVRRRLGIVLPALGLALGLGGGATWQTVLAGESGSRAIWQGSFTETPR